MQPTPPRPTPCLAVVVPCWNEEEVLPSTLDTLIAEIDRLIAAELCTTDSFVVCVDDGSQDATWSIVATAHRGGRRVEGVRLAVNAGHQSALVAGLEAVVDRVDVTISMDADLQDDPAALVPMLEAYRRGAEIVLGVRSARPGDGLFKRITAGAFYDVMHLLGVDLVKHHADFRLMSRAAVRNLTAFSEYHLFLRGLQTRLHGRLEIVHFENAPRRGGESKYPLRRMLSLAWTGITSFSIVPLRLVALAGALVFLAATAAALYALARKATGQVVEGWTSLAVPLYMLNGVTLFALGVVGEYVGKIYMEVKRRPRYLVDTTTFADRPSPAGSPSR